ncbi:MAG: CtsR family transcriptional regulator [Clostridiales bacterium]|nr:CtsR family transcriptional regulator [Clostridiales bacterium]
MKMSDLIAEKILQLLDASGRDSAEIKRNEMAESVGCVPSQINYVLTSRFTPEQGYIVESRRGGGGYIRITRVRLNRASALMHIINSIGDRLDDSSARAVLDNCIYGHLIGEGEGAVMEAALSAPVLREAPAESRQSLRAALLKRMLLTQI